MLLRVSVLLLAALVPAPFAAAALTEEQQATCTSIDSLETRRNGERNRAIGALAMLLGGVVPLALGANALVRARTTDKRFERLYADFQGDRVLLQNHIEETCGLRVTVRYLKDGSSVTQPGSLAGIVLGAVVTVMVCVLQVGATVLSDNTGLGLPG